MKKRGGEGGGEGERDAWRIFLRGVKRSNASRRAGKKERKKKAEVIFPCLGVKKAQEMMKAVDNIAIHSTFSLLKSYIQWLTLQEETLVAFLKKYPNNLVTSLNEKGNCCLKIKSNKPNRPVFNVEWGRKVVVDRVEADIKLMVDAPKEYWEE
ncbi:hypothetical protein Btru_025844 [Bulinus truncatus]|nr:hypothetical protein Btru_025844 [Bulinus truncatus]